jgi:hypothetical protein
MNKFILAALLALPLAALSQSRAAAGGDCCCHSCCSPTICCNVGFKFKCWCSCSCCCDDCGCNPCGGGGCGPWYAYWPYNAHFQTPAPTGYPGWPSGQGAMMYGSSCAYNYGPPSPAMALPAPAPMPYSAPTIQPCGYVPAQVPSYWYGR